MTSILSFKEKVCIEGLLPERALLRLRRAGIDVYNLQKTQKNRIVFLIKKKDIEKLFAIYPNVCYNGNVHSAYTAQRLGAVGAMKYVEKARKRVGLLLGGLLCFALTAASEPLVFSVECAGSAVYEREVRAALDEADFGVFKPYKTGKEDEICAKILALDGVEYCSVKKTGHRLIVEVQTSPFPALVTQKGKMAAAHSGTIRSMTVLRGTALKKVGESVQAGDILVEDSFDDGIGGQVRVEIIARVRIACVWEREMEAQSAEEAFAQGYLELGLSERDEIKKTEITQTETGYFVRIEYEAVETLNF